MSGHVDPSAGTILAAAQDPSIPASSLLFFDATGTPGNFVAPTGSRKIAGRFTVATNRVTITHPDVLASSRVLVSYEGDMVAMPAATRRISARCTAGFVDVYISAGAIANDGDFFLTIEVI